MVGAVGLFQNDTRLLICGMIAALQNKEKNMHPRSQEVVNYLDQTRTEMREAVESVPANARDQKPADDQWSVAQVLDHVAIVHNMVARSVGKWIAEAQSRGLGPETSNSSLLNTIPSERVLDRSRKVQAPERIQPRNDIDAETAWREFEQAQDNLRAAFLTGDGLALDQVVQPHPVLGPINVYQWTLFNGSHEARHALQIREIGERFTSKNE